MKLVKRLILQHSGKINNVETGKRKINCLILGTQNFEVNTNLTVNTNQTLKKKIGIENRKNALKDQKYLEKKR